MSTLCADQHKLCPSHLLSSNKHLQDFLEIAPRKLLSNKTFQENPDMSPYESNLHKFLPSNNANNNSLDDDDLDPYSSDHFRMYEFKVRRCTRSRSHDWTDCPFAHPGEKARRRDPRKYHYSGTVCPEFRRGGCSRGDSCEFAHGVFECWLHPSRYRTEACKDGRNCKRKVCFFAHSPRQLRILPEISSSSPSPCNSSLKHGHACCLACHSVISSPTSTLLGMSPPLSPSLSPPLSPVKHCGFSPVSRYGDRVSKLRSGIMMSYKEVLNELMNSLEAMKFQEVSNSINTTNPWIDTCCSFKGDDHHHQHQQQLILSPSTPSPSVNFFNGDCTREEFFDEKIRVNNDNGDNSSLASFDHPDLGWVNELLK